MFCQALLCPSPRALTRLPLGSSVHALYFSVPSVDSPYLPGCVGLDLLELLLLLAGCGSGGRVLEIEPRALYMLDKRSASKPYLSVHLDL